jgi:hypothetical protein
MKFYSGSEADCLAELDVLIEDLTAAAHEAIEQAAAEAARAAALAALDREMALLAEAALLAAEAEGLRGEIKGLKKRGVTAAVITGAVCLLGGFVAGAVVIR